MEFNKPYIDAQHAIVRKLNFVCLFLIAIAFGSAMVSVKNIMHLKKERDRLMMELEKCKTAN